MLEHAMLLIQGKNWADVRDKIAREWTRQAGVFYVIGKVEVPDLSQLIHTYHGDDIVVVVHRRFKILGQTFSLCGVWA